MLCACLSEPLKIAQASLMTQLMPLLPGWVFVYKGLASLLRTESVTEARYSSTGIKLVGVNQRKGLCVGAMCK